MAQEPAPLTALALYRALTQHLHAQGFSQLTTAEMIHAHYPTLWSLAMAEHARTCCQAPSGKR